MFRSVFSKTAAYLIILVFVVPVVLLFLFGNLAKKQIKNASTPIPTSTSAQNVPLPSKEDIVRTFCELIDEDRISDAVSMLNTSDDSTRQSWGVSLNNFSSFKLITIKPSSIDETGNSFEVDINVTLKENLQNLPIPNNGWVNGVNKKWIGVLDNGSGRYKITGIASGP